MNPNYGKPCSGCPKGRAMFQRLDTGELLCPVCAAVDADEHLPPEPIEARIGEGVGRVLGFFGQFLRGRDFAVALMAAAAWMVLTVTFNSILSFLIASLGLAWTSYLLDLAALLAGLVAAAVVVVAFRWARRSARENISEKHEGGER